MAINNTSKDYIKGIVENDNLYFWLYDFLNQIIKPALLEQKSR